MTAERRDFDIVRLTPTRAELYDRMLDLFAQAFDDVGSYAARRPSHAYTQRLLAREDIFVLVAVTGSAVVGGLVAYELMKFEQERSEVYIYDLAVAQGQRRAGIATALIAALKGLARARGAYVIYVQADYGDDPAVALYSKIGVREDVMHFDIDVD